VQHEVGSGVLLNAMEGVFRVRSASWRTSGFIGRTKDVHRGSSPRGGAQTIAAYEHDEPARTHHIDRYSTVHVRLAGTNF